MTLQQARQEFFEEHPFAQSAGFEFPSTSGPQGCMGVAEGEGRGDPLEEACGLGIGRGVHPKIVISKIKITLNNFSPYPLTTNLNLEALAEKVVRPSSVLKITVNLQKNPGTPIFLAHKTSLTCPIPNSGLSIDVTRSFTLKGGIGASSSSPRSPFPFPPLSGGPEGGFPITLLMTEAIK